MGSGVMSQVNAGVCESVWCMEREREKKNDDVDVEGGGEETRRWRSSSFFNDITLDSISFSFVT